MSLNLKRPKRGEDEDDLLEFQEQFLKNMNQQPSAKVIKETDTAQLNKETTQDTDVKMDFDLDDQALSKILNDVVVEKSTESKINSHTQTDSEIPKIEKINLALLNSTTGPKKKSLFAQNLESKGKLKSFYSLDKVIQLNDLNQNEKIKSIKKNLLKASADDKTEKLKRIITGEGLGNSKDAEQIHLENLERLSQMKPEEILQEQHKLINQLDPKLVSFIRKRKPDENAQTELLNERVDELNKKKKDLIEDLPIKPDKRWLHMDKIEYEKLEWMIKPRNIINGSQSEISKSARFDFQGNVMSNAEEVPVTLALHHHGNEPDLAGYTLDELFHLSRSKFNQQRVLALQVISNILAKCHQGDYYEIIKAGSYTNKNELDDDDLEKNENDKHNLLNQLIDGGILYLLRWSLDDQTESIINVSLNGLKNILQPLDQENMLDVTFDLLRGQEVPSLYPFSELVDDISSQSQLLYKLDKNLNLNERKELDQLTDEEYIKCDLVKGLFRMNLMARLYYLLDKYQPTYASNQVIHNIFMILYRCLRHSAEICHDFAENQLLDLIVRNFMPKFLTSNELENSSMLINLTHSIKLLRLICSSGSHISFKMCKKYDLNNRILNYLSLFEGATHNGSNTEMIQLQTESFRLLKVLTVYASEHSQSSFETVSNSFQLILKHLNHLTTLKTLDEYKCQLLKAIISLFNNLTLNALIDDDDENLKLKYEMCSAIYSIVQTYTFNQFKLFLSNSISFNVSLVSVCLNFISDYLEKIVHGSFFKFDNSSKKPTDSVVEHLIEPFLQNNVNQSKLDDLIMSKLTSNSILSTETAVWNKQKRIQSNNLSYLPTLLNDMSNGEEISSFCFLAAYFRLYSICLKFNVKFFEQNDFASTRSLLSNSYLRSYLRLLIKSENKTGSFLRIKYENLMVFSCLKLVSSIINLEDLDSNRSFKSEDKRFFYLVSIHLMSQLRQGDEYYAHDLIASFIFNVNVWSTYLLNNETNFLVKHFEQMKLNEIDQTKNKKSLEFSYSDLNIGKSETIKIDKKFISNLESLQIYENLNQIKLTYLESNCLFNAHLFENSRRLADLNRLNCLLKSKFYSNKSLLPSDWIYAPIKYHLKNIQSKKESKIKEEESSTLKIISSVSNTLKFVYMLEAYFSDFLDTSGLDVTYRFVHLLYVYLFESEVFLDRQVVTYLYLIYFKFVIDKKCPLEHLNLSKPIPEIISFYDFYQSLLTQYDATSFGDYIFSMYIIVPLQQSYPVKFRQLFWSDFHHLFKYIKLATDSTKLLLPMKNFIQPNEKSLNMIRLYSQILLDADDFRMISGSKFGYSIMIAHLNAFIFEHTINVEQHIERDFKKLLMNSFFSLGNEKLKHDLVYFKCLNLDNNNQEFYDELPAIRQQWLKKMSS